MYKRKAVLISCFDWYEKRLQPIKELLDKEYDVTILISDFDHISKCKMEVKNTECTYISVPVYKKNISVQRMYSHTVFGKQVNKYLEKLKPDLVYLLLPPNNTAKYCLNYKRRNKDTKYVIDLIDLWPESMPLGKLKNTFLFKKWAQLRNDTIAEADFIFTECDLYQQKLKNIIRENDRVQSLYLFKEQNESQQNIVKEKLHKKKCELQLAKKETQKKISLGYVGSINHIIDIKSICQLIRALNEKGYLVQFNIIGDGESRQQFIEQLEIVGAKINYYGKVFDEIKKIEILSSCDYGINMMKDEVTVGLSIKSIDYFSMGLPLINSIKGDTWNLVKEKKIGINYDGDTERCIEEIECMEVEEMYDKVLDCYQELFTKQAFRDTFLKCWEKFNNK